MQCPLCRTELKIMERQGIEIDFCPQCRGVWLDRGELDKIIERSTSAPYAERGQSELRPESRPEYRPEARPEYSRPYPDRDSRDYKRDDDDDDYRGHKRHKRKNFLSELFDFD